MAYTPYNSTDTTTQTTNTRLNYSDFSGEGISNVPGYLYYIAMGDGNRALPGFVFISREDARTARRSLSTAHPGSKFRMYRVSVSSEIEKTS
jgi:hypothetical protein